MEARETRKIEIELLKFEHGNRRSEIEKWTASYDRISSYTILYASTILTVLNTLLSARTGALAAPISAEAARAVSWVLLALGPLVALFLLARLLDALSMIYFNAARAAAVERLLNERVGSNLLIWDSELVPRWFGFGRPLLRGWVKPQLLQGLWGFLFVGMTMALYCIAFAQLSPAHWQLYAILLFGLTSVHAYDFVALNVGAERLRERVYAWSHAAAQFAVVAHDSAIRG